MPTPPLAPKRPHPITQHDQERVDHYFWMRYRDDPVAFAREVIGIEPDPWQVELLDAVAAPAVRRISVRSGHGVGKSTAVAMAAIWHVLMRLPSKTVVTAPTSSQLFDACFAEMKNVAKRLKPPFHNLLEIKSDRI